MRGATAVASRSGEAYLVVRVGPVLLYIEDRDALDALRPAVRKAGALADAGRPRSRFRLDRDAPGGGSRPGDGLASGSALRHRMPDKS